MITTPTQPLVNLAQAVRELFGGVQAESDYVERGNLIRASYKGEVITARVLWVNVEAGTATVTWKPGIVARQAVISADDIIAVARRETIERGCVITSVVFGRAVQETVFSVYGPTVETTSGTVRHFAEIVGVATSATEAALFA